AAASQRGASQPPAETWPGSEGQCSRPVPGRSSNSPFTTCPYRSLGLVCSEPIMARRRLHVAHHVVIEHDLHLLALDLPVAHGGQPAEDPTGGRHQPAAPVHERLPRGLGKFLVLLAGRPAKAEDVLARGAPGNALRGGPAGGRG